MVLLLRILALFIGLTVMSTFWDVGRVIALGFGPATWSSTLGKLTLAAWGLTLVVGPFAAVQLRRLKESGRRAPLHASLPSRDAPSD